jgi:hypothetical protein
VEVGLPCAGAEVGRIHATGSGVDKPGEGDSLWVALRGGVAGAWVLDSWVDLRARVDVVAPLVRPRFVLTGVHEPTPVHEPTVAGRAGLAVEIRF